MPGIHLCNKHLLLQIFGPSCCLMPNLRRLWFTCMKGSMVFWCGADRCTASPLRLPLRLDNGRVTVRSARRRSYMCIAVISLCPLQVPKRALAQHRAHASGRSVNVEPWPPWPLSDCATVNFSGHLDAVCCMQKSPERDADGTRKRRGAAATDEDRLGLAWKFRHNEVASELEQVCACASCVLDSLWRPQHSPCTIWNAMHRCVTRSHGTEPARRSGQPDRSMGGSWGAGKYSFAWTALLTHVTQALVGTGLESTPAQLVQAWPAHRPASCYSLAMHCWCLLQPYG